MSDSNTNTITDPAPLTSESEASVHHDTITQQSPLPLPHSESTPTTTAPTTSTTTTTVAPPTAAKKKIVLKRAAPSASSTILGEPPKYNVRTPTTTSSSTTDHNAVNSVGTLDLPNAQHRRAKVIKARFLTQFQEDVDGQTTTTTSTSTLPPIKRVIELQLHLGEGVHYQPGDYIAVYPHNPTVIVDRLIAKLKRSADELLEITCTNATQQLPPHLIRANGKSLRHLLTHELDICGVVSKRLLKLLSELAQDTQEKETLAKCSTIEGKDIYAKLLEDRVTLVDLLETYTSCKEVPLHLLLDVVSALMPRDYSISSSPLTCPTEASIVFSVVDVPLTKGHTMGLCTSYLESLCTQHKLLDSKADDIESSLSNLSIKDDKSIDGAWISYQLKATPHFHLPTDHTKPLIMIGPGTGVAPFIGFLQHLRHQQLKGVRSLYFGCRSEMRDYLFKDTLQSFINDGILDHLHTAFSRESQTNEALGYIQDKIKDNAKQLFDMIQLNKGYVYICGDAKGMAVGVRKTFVEIIQEQMNLNENDAAEVWVTWSKEKRYLLDVWS
ncbi:hypothetical protein SAMD00019534_083250 [Acytostelium subglobosum LB1]|uniref:hypothetical protein n=1 Tax=Acytostelium subglobosum LB1 TaxID=1410327 RepID=UPI000644D0B0|nr:hypothetical protein SAMD00019534_083250 [Acytostelium subglobosum LB1]GAM25150.1 hypothetical protein SAMD00019534_083250 [Acytostelium subglobosum LB1]|eukprot:XP_012751670.1 hypothetical protein SAMD00019534_083250 [Acytostelium subglobosum LB1]